MNQPMPKGFQGWVANLSNGYNVFEGQPQPGERTPWQQFIDYIQSNQTYEKDVWDEKSQSYRKLLMPVFITRMHLVWAGRTAITLPYKQCDGYYQATEVQKSVLTGAERRLRGIGSVVGENVFIIWVDENGEVIQDVRTLQDSRPHTTLRNPIHADPTTGNQP